MSHKFPLGARGEQPVVFRVQLDSNTAWNIRNIPGVSQIPGGIKATWDAAPVVAKLLNLDMPKAPVEDQMTDAELEAEVTQLPGLARYKALQLGSKARDYQKDGAIFLARRAYALNCDPMRSGKSFQALSASVLVDAKRTLIVAPALAKWVWAAEIAKWLNEEAIVLEGRGSDLARQYCLACDSRGKLNGQHCPACKMRNGQSRGFKRFSVRDLPCRIHPDVRGHEGASCASCLAELHQAVDSVRYVIVNYDLLVSQKEVDAAGQAFYRQDLEGWGPFLAQHNFDLCIADECHLLRNFSTDQKKKGTTRREKFNQVTENIPRVWGLTGTPIFGYVRDLWGQLDSISKGAMTGNNRLPFAFHTRFCEGHKGDYGWRADGRSVLADSELPERLKYVKIQRPRSLILSSMPPKVRQVIRLEDTREDKKTPRIPKNADNESRLTRMMRATFDAKVEMIVDNVINEMAEGNKVVLFALLRQSAERLHSALNRAIVSRDNATKMREVRAVTWLAHGDASTQTRFEAARAFREHSGAGAFVATIDAVQVAVSLKGAASVHFAEMHWQPSAMLQAEDRPYEVGTTGLNIVYYVVKDSIDEHISSSLLPKIEALVAVLSDQQANEVRNSIHGPEKVQTLDEILADLLAGVDTSVADAHFTEED